jgi:predicted unusual protein kinase regulating ubiquinone biosynthesis (AarF/ABC1/UbiB family)
LITVILLFFSFLFSRLLIYNIYNISSSYFFPTQLEQWAATRRDLFPLSFCRIAGRVQDRSEHAHGGAFQAWLSTKKVLDSEFQPFSIMKKVHKNSDDDDDNGATEECGWTWSVKDTNKGFHHSYKLIVDGYSTDHNPPMIGAGCVASVYKGRIYHVTKTSSSAATMKAEKMTDSMKKASHDSFFNEENRIESGVEVAIKVITPEVNQNIDVDLTLMKSAAWILESIPFLKLK